MRRTAFPPRWVLVSIAALVACSEPGAPGSDAAVDDAPPDGDGGAAECVASCEACGLAYCAGHCGAHRACLEATRSCGAILECIMGPAVDAGPLPRRSVWLQPSDLATAVDVEDLGAYATGELAPNADEAFAAALVLTDAAGAVVPSTWELAPVDRAGDARVRLRPDAPLAEGWYVLRVETWPEGYAPAVTALPGEGRAIRVRVGSAPRLVRVDVCERSRDVWQVAVHASELLRASSLEGAVIEREGAACAVATLGDGADGAGGVTFTCDRLAPEENLRVRFPAGATSITGTALEGPGSAAGAPLELSRGHAIPIADTCVAAPVPLEAGVVPAFDAL